MRRINNLIRSMTNVTMVSVAALMLLFIALIAVFVMLPRPALEISIYLIAVLSILSLLMSCIYSGIHLTKLKEIKGRYEPVPEFHEMADQGNITADQRIAVYLTAILEIKLIIRSLKLSTPIANRKGLCSIIAEVAEANGFGYFSPITITKNFIELKEEWIKLGMTSLSGYWWELDAEGYEQRILALLRMIESAKRKQGH